MGSFIIYGLVDPRTREIRYVGQSTSGLRRPNVHRLPSYSRPSTHKNNWIRSLLSIGLDYEVIMLEDVPRREGLNEAERHWVAIGRAALGDRLTNATEGGDGLHRPSKVTREKIAASLRGRKRTPEECEKNAAAHRGRPLSPEHRAKVAAAMRKRVFTPEHRARIVAARIGKPTRGAAYEEQQMKKNQEQRVAF